MIIELGIAGVSFVAGWLLARDGSALDSPRPKDLWEANWYLQHCKNYAAKHDLEYIVAYPTTTDLAGNIGICISTNASRQVTEKVQNYLTQDLEPRHDNTNH